MQRTTMRTTMQRTTMRRLMQRAAMTTVRKKQKTKTETETEKYKKKAKMIMMVLLIMEGKEQKRRILMKTMTKETRVPKRAKVVTLRSRQKERAAQRKRRSLSLTIGKIISSRMVMVKMKRQNLIPLELSSRSMVRSRERRHQKQRAAQRKQ